MSQLRISAIVPYFEAHKTIENALRSLIEGDLPPDEIVLVNDGSSQESRNQLKDIVLALKPKFPPISVVDHQHNLGSGFARNTAVLHAKNSWIFCLDADNLAPKNLLMSIARFIDENAGSVEIASPERLIFFDDTSKTVSHTWTFKNSVLTSEEFINRTVLPRSSGNYLFSKDSWYKAGGYPIAAGALENWGFGLRLHLAGYQTHVVPSTFYFHRIGIDSLYARDSRDMERLSLIATAQVLEDASRLPSRLVRRLLNARKARSWLSKIKVPTLFNDPKLGFDEGYATPREEMQPTELEGLEGLLLGLERRLNLH